MINSSIVIRKPEFPNCMILFFALLWYFAVISSNLSSENEVLFAFKFLNHLLLFLRTDLHVVLPLKTPPMNRNIRWKTNSHFQNSSSRLFWETRSVKAPATIRIVREIVWEWQAVHIYSFPWHAFLKRKK